jgi:hypothetical protein
MNRLTNQATTRDWIDATRDINISAYPIYKSSRTVVSAPQISQDVSRRVKRQVKAVRRSRKSRV